jgi:hypothetical protein
MLKVEAIFPLWMMAALLAANSLAPAFGQTQPTRPSAFATFPTLPELPTAPLSPCYRDSSFNRTSSCYTGTPYPSYSAAEPSAFPNARNRDSSPRAVNLDAAQARSLIEGKGYSNISGLQKDSRGIWRGKGEMENGRPVEVTLDLDGNIYSEPSRLDIRIERAPYRRSNRQ